MNAKELTKVAGALSSARYVLEVDEVIWGDDVAYLSNKGFPVGVVSRETFNKMLGEPT